MDKRIAYRLIHDERFRTKVSKIARDYLKVGRDLVDYWVADFDVAYDLFLCHAPLDKGDFEKLSKGHPKRFILPMTSTQVTTMTTFIAQMLFGQETPHLVEARIPENDVGAEFVNQLLRWNCEQQPSYMLGYLWVQDAIIANRGIFYNSWKPIQVPKLVQEELDDPFGEPDAEGNQSKYTRTRQKLVEKGGYCRFEYVSPYDWFSDPALPIHRFQEGRFSGHRTTITLLELEARSKLPVESPAYVLPEVVQTLKSKKQTNGVSSPILPGAGPAPTEVNSKVSRSAYERSRASSPAITSSADKEDGGVCNIHEIWIRLVPADYGLYSDEEGDGTDPVIWQFLIGNGTEVLALSESSYQHGQFPYSAAEARPNGMFQFAPSWAMLMKGMQDYVDWLKNRHQEALSRTIGNIFIIDPDKVDVDDFLNPEKEGQLIMLKPGASGSKISECIQQVPLKDMTEGFLGEMGSFVKMSETVSGASVQMQGTPTGESSATEYAGTMQMGAGRMASIARILSEEGLVPQTKQFVSNFQTFLEGEQSMRFVPRDNTPESLMGIAALKITRDHIQGDYDYIAHDGTLPGPDSKKVAAITTLLQAAAAFPQVFEPAPGNLDPRKLIFEGAKASGLKISAFKYKDQDLAGAGGAGALPPAPDGPPPPGQQNPGPAPTIPQLTPPSLSPLTSASPVQIRPGSA